MKITCPHCSQNIEIDDGLAVTVLDCPSCHQTFTVPPAQPPPTRTSGPQPPQMKRPPPTRAPLKPITGRSPARKKSRIFSGCLEILLILFVIGVCAFRYAMYRWQESAP